MGALGVIDIGSHKIKVAIFSSEEGGIPEILSVAEIESKGVDKGSILKPSTAKRQIKKAVEIAENGAGVSADAYYVIISHPNLKSSNEKAFLDFKGELTEIDETHLAELKRQVEENAKEQGFQIIHIIPRYYLLDGEKHYEPEGLVASKIEAEYHVIKLPLITVKNTERIITALKLIPQGNLFGAYTASLGILDDEDYENNILLVDLGHTTTSYIYFKDGAPLYSGVLNVGGKLVTEEIAHAFGIPYQEAERLKHEYAAVGTVEVGEEEEVIAKDKEGHDVAIPLRDLIQLTDEVIREIFEAILLELYKKGVDLEEEIDEIVLIGGGAHIKGIKELISQVGPFSVRLGIPKNISSLHDKAMDPQFAQAVGVAVYTSIGDEDRVSSEGLFTGPLNELLEENLELESLSTEETAEKGSKGKGILGKIAAFFKNIFSGD